MDSPLPEKWRKEEGHSLSDYQIFIDFLYKTMALNPFHRIKPLEALQHPFFDVKIPPQIQSFKFRQTKLVQTYPFLIKAVPEQIEKVIRENSYFSEIKNFDYIEGDIISYDPTDSFEYRIVKSIISEPTAEKRLRYKVRDGRATSNEPKSNSGNSGHSSGSKQEPDQKTPSNTMLSIMHSKEEPPWPKDIGAQNFDINKLLLAKPPKKEFKGGDPMLGKITPKIVDKKND